MCLEPFPLYSTLSVGILISQVFLFTGFLYPFLTVGKNIEVINRYSYIKYSYVEFLLCLICGVVSDFFAILLFFLLYTAFHSLPPTSSYSPVVGSPTV
jgi:hypothetical protein